MLEAQKNLFGSADAHTRRVTLNLVRAATCCPDDLVSIVDQLAATGWDWGKLTAADYEAVYGLMNDELVERAKAEFSIDTTTVVDMDRQGHDHPEFVDSDGDKYCPLCGHKHIRWGFTLRNLMKNPESDDLGRDLLTGSTCVVQYGLRVDGSMTAEAALESLNKAINRLLRQAECEDWRKSRPTHAADMATLAEAEAAVGKRWFRAIYGRARYALPTPWGPQNRHHAAFGKWARAALKYYGANGFLTADRTEAYESWALSAARTIVAQVAEAKATDPAVNYWNDWLARHPGINAWERERIEQIRFWGYERKDLYAGNLGLVVSIESRHAEAALPPPPPLPDDSDNPAPTPAAKAEPKVDDVSDLPGMG